MARPPCPSASGGRCVPGSVEAPAASGRQRHGPAGRGEAAAAAPETSGCCCCHLTSQLSRLHPALCIACTLLFRPSSTCSSASASCSRWPARSSSSMRRLCYALQLMCDVSWEDPCSSCRAGCRVCMGPSAAADAAAGSHTRPCTPLLQAPDAMRSFCAALQVVCMGLGSYVAAALVAILQVLSGCAVVPVLCAASGRAKPGLPAPAHSVHSRLRTLVCRPSRQPVVARAGWRTTSTRRVRKAGNCKGGLCGWRGEARGRHLPSRLRLDPHCSPVPLILFLACRATSTTFSGRCSL